LATSIEGQLQDLSVMDAEALIKDRREKYLNMGDKALI
jgi:acetyl-CoA carboxylase alpha subunit